MNFNLPYNGAAMLQNLTGGNKIGIFLGGGIPSGKTIQTESFGNQSSNELPLDALYKSVIHDTENSKRFAKIPVRTIETK